MLVGFSTKGWIAFAEIETHACLSGRQAIASAAHHRRFRNAQVMVSLDSRGTMSKVLTVPDEVGTNLKATDVHRKGSK